jgi:hypothetical protein
MHLEMIPSTLWAFVFVAKRMAAVAQLLQKKSKNKPH